jgi:hypothetical protein
VASTEAGYLISVRAVKIDWDNDKRTVLITNLPKKKVELFLPTLKDGQLKNYNSANPTVSLNRVAGYGKKCVSNERVKEALSKLNIKQIRE